MEKVLNISPITRVEGHLDIEVTVDQVGGLDQVVDARVSSTTFRGFEQILAGRDPRDAVQLTQRVCGVCPVSHALASSMAVESAQAVSPPANGRILRNFVLGANYIQSHVLHFYHLALPDYLDTGGVLAMSPWKPNFTTQDSLRGDAASSMMQHYLQALVIRRKAHQLGAIFGGRLPGVASFVAGGASEIVTSQAISDARAVLGDIRTFIDGVYLPDIATLQNSFPQYGTLGRGCGNLLAYGVFDLNAAGTSKLLARGRYTSGEAGPVDLSLIKEYVGHSWFTPASGGQNPASGVTEPALGKSGAYSWNKAPRYEDEVHEVGPLARMWVNGDYRRGISAMDRLAARALETKKVADAMDGWLDELVPGGPVYAHASMPMSATGEGATEAARGALGHWLQVSDTRISRYQIVTPTAWNASPRDDAGRQGAMEQALVGTPVSDTQNPLEVLRVVHSFDPCLACSVHAIRPRKRPLRTLSALLAVLAMAPAAWGYFSVPLVPVGDPGNPGDATGFGSVPHEYCIGKYEVTNGQYAAFLNAVAAADPSNLYNDKMSIQRSGSSGGYSYSTSAPNAPVKHVSWYDALRFANWLHNGRPSGAQGAGTTEDGAYAFTGPASAGARKPLAKFFLPGEDEWYKAAYYDCAEEAAYWEYPTRSASPPAAASPSADAGKSNYDNAVLDVTDVGSYPASASYYGTFDQAGNVWEWIEDAVEDGRGIRGGSWNDYELLLRAWYRDSEKPDFESEFIGFRVAATGSADLNSAPAVEAGPDQAIALPSPATLGATAADDGLPRGALSLAWEKASGPGSVTFANSAAESTTASFSVAGTYVLRLTASDGLSSSSDTLTVTVSGSQGVPFRRGNFNQDAGVDISDGISVLNFLFLGGAAPRCFSAADANDDAKVDISDGIYTLTYLFLGGKAIPAPFSACGADPTPDSLTCEAFTGCGN